MIPFNQRSRKIVALIGNLKRAHILNFYCMLFMLFPLLAHASFIETTIGTAVVNDATASYYNPAALVLLKNTQIIPQGTVAYFHTQFSGQTTPIATGVRASGNASSNTHYTSPSLFFGMPVTDKFILGFAMVTNSANRNADENSILRYVQASNQIQDYDLMPALAIKINEFFSIGGGVNFSYAKLDLKPIIGFPGSNIADSQSHNQSDGTGVGANAGFLIKLNPVTVIGFNYRSMTTYHLSGKSVYAGPPQMISNDYHYQSWSPARSVLSINHFLTPKLGLISTLQRIQWSIFQNVHVHNIANVSGGTPTIVNGTIPYYLHDTWLLTLGSHYRITPTWILRVAGSYNQSPNNSHYQIGTGDSFILGASTGYEINKTMTIDGSYAHAFIKNENINIAGNQFLIQGVNDASRDSVSLKLTFNI